jgi:hypothetical protein
MHGVALTLLLNSSHRKIAAKMANKRPVTMKVVKMEASTWNNFEGFSKEEFFKIGIYKQFFTILKSEEIKKEINDKNKREQDIKNDQHNTHTD